MDEDVEDTTETNKNNMVSQPEDMKIEVVNPHAIKHLYKDMVFGRRNGCQYVPKGGSKGSGG